MEKYSTYFDNTINVKYYYLHKTLLSFILRIKKRICKKYKFT
jgi:hypothetical protein